MQRGPDDPDGRASQVDRGDEVDTQVGNLLVEAVDTGRGNRRLIRALAVSIVLDVLLSLGLGFFALKAISTQRDLKHQSLVTCQQFNVTRAGELALWQPILATPPAPLKPDATPEEKQAYEAGLAARRQFEGNLHKYFDPIDCKIK